MKIPYRNLGTIAALLGGLLLGCSDHDHDGHDHEGHDHDHATEASESGEELPEGLQGLDPAELALVKAQGDCPVSSEPLGSMGAPIRKEVDGKVAFLCCKSCVKKFDADPAKYFAMLEKK